MHNSTENALSGSAPKPVASGLGRRLMAMVYDSFLLIALFALVSLPIVMQVGEQAINHNLLILSLYRLVLLISAFLFFGWFWTHGGQTLGMRAWRLQTIQDDGSPVTWASAARRFLAALVSWGCAGLGFLWVLVDRENLAWHDRWSGTRVIVLPKKTS